jgi:hypothetical protein
MCPTEHTTLELTDGTRLQPTGPLWQAYQPHQVDGQLLRIGYKTGASPAPAGSLGTVSAQLSCLEAPEAQCTLPPFLN